MSSFFKKSSDFKPKSIAPLKSGEKKDWHAAPLAEGEPPGHLTSVSNETERSHSSLTELQSPQGETIQPRTVEPEPGSEKAISDTPDNTRTDPAAASQTMPDIETIQEEAYAAGIEQGRKQADVDFGSATSALALVSDQLNTLRETILKNSKNEMIELVLVLSEKIIRHSVSEQNQTIVDSVESALQQAVKSSEFYIYLHPDDMHTIQERAQNFISGLNGLDNLIIKSDQTIERGGCKVESENCTVDATIASQFKVIQETLREET